jgi:hypothetical protein
VVREPLIVTWAPGAEDDLDALEAAGRGLADLGLEAVSDVANRHKTGKELGQRNVSGDLTGLRRVRFDLEGHRPERFRLVYRLIGTDGMEVVGLGERASHAVYRHVLGRL